MTRTLSAETIRFGMLTFIVMLLMHAVAYLTHEYSHSVVAWALGWMEHPFGIDFGPPSLYNFIFLGDVEDNVAYDPIFASGHGVTATIIALSGPFIGNGLLYFIVYGLTKRTALGASRLATTLNYWLAVMCAGNVWSYVPLRAVAAHGDIALAARGLDMSPWLFFPIIAVPSFFIIWHFFARMFPLCHQIVSHASAGNFIIVSTMTAWWFFMFFTGDGYSSHSYFGFLLAVVSRFVFLPLCVSFFVARYFGEYRETRTSAIIQSP
jgi:hypothetical protein